MSVDAAAPELPQCPEHPLSPALGSCVRCGRFVCEVCAVSRSPLRCAGCDALEQQRLLLGAGPLEFSRTLAHAFTLFAESSVTLLAVAVVTTTLETPIARALQGGVPSTATLVTPMVFGLVDIFPTAMAMLVVHRRALALPDAMGPSLLDALRAYVPLFVIRFITNLVVGCGLALVVVPGLLWWASYTASAPVGLFEGLRGTAAMSRSEALAAGHRGPILGIHLLTTFGGALLTFIFAVVARRLHLHGAVGEIFVLFADRAGVVGSVIFDAVLLVAIYAGLLASEQQAAQALENAPAQPEAAQLTD